LFFSYYFRRRRIGFRHFRPAATALSGYGAAGPESDEENSPGYPACLADLSRRSFNEGGLILLAQWNACPIEFRFANSP
jgi:hypothetical protein